MVEILYVIVFILLFVYLKDRNMILIIPITILTYIIMYRYPKSKFGGKQHKKQHKKQYKQPQVQTTYANRNLLLIEKKVFSQNGEDGIIECIFDMIGTTNKYYVEFGVEDGNECNSKNLRVNHGWTGLMMDGGNDNKDIGLHQEFITRENILDLLRKYNVPTELDMLSIDIDGNDYYVWEEILKEYKPRMVVMEYNAKFKPPDDRTIKYNPTHMWKSKTYPLSSYYGASMQALYRLGKANNYTLVANDGIGINLFFLRDDVFEPVASSFPMAGQPMQLFRETTYNAKWSSVLEPGQEWIYTYSDEVPLTRYRVGDNKDSKFAYDWFYTLDFPSTDVGIMKLSLQNGYLFEKYTTMFINSYAKPDDIIVDIGTNIGCISIPVSKMVPQGKVISFEVFRSTYNTLVSNIALNNCTNIIPVNMSIGHKNMMTTLDADVEKFEDYKVQNFNTNLLDNIGGVKLGKKGPQVQMTTLDSWLVDNKITRVDIIKIDVEGAEPLAFKGAAETIRRNKPIIIFEKNFQFITENMRSSMNIQPEDELDILQYAIELGYKTAMYVPRDNIILIHPSRRRIMEDSKMVFKESPIELLDSKKYPFRTYNMIKPRF